MTHAADLRRTLAGVVCLMWALSPIAGVAQEAPPPSGSAAPDIVVETHGPFRRLFTTLIRDVKQLPSKDNRAILLNGAILTAAVVPFDRVGTERASSSTVLKTSFAGFGKGIGREWVQGGGALAAYVGGRLWGKPRLVAASGDLIEAQIVAAAITQGIKFAVQRTRPDGEARSFPSGHASAAFATASTLGRHFGRKAALPAYAVAIYTSLSRLQANSHYGSDLVAGATIGIAVGRTATIGVGKHHVSVAPTVIPDGVGVALTPARR